ncbi:MAG: hypothetical protein QM640_04085 [Niabella sp.]
MNGMLHALSDSILAKRFEACSVDELKELANKYPYASSVQFLLAQKMKQENAEHYDVQLQKTLLYYKNPVFINYLLNGSGAAQQQAQPRYLPGNITEKSNDPQNVIISYSIISGPENAAADDIIREDGPAPVSATEAGSVPATDNTAAQSGGTDKLPEDSLSENIAPEAQNNTENNGEEQDVGELQPLPEFKIETIDPSKTELSFTPYHTIDYFAAQGINLNEEQHSNDRFGSQLKSFTQWLKHMKRLPAAQTNAGAAPGAEKEIEQMAEQSLTGGSAATEAMAAVWIKQGNLQKAIEIYQKLSLQNPLKSAYFAAKADHLKK